LWDPSCDFKGQLCTQSENWLNSFCTGMCVGIYLYHFHTKKVSDFLAVNYPCLFQVCIYFTLYLTSCKNFLLFSSIVYVSCVDRLQSSISCIEFSECQTDIWLVIIMNENFLHEGSCIIKMTPLNYCWNILQRMCMMHVKYFHCFETFMLLSTHQSSNCSESETLTGNFRALFVMLSQLKYIWVISYSSVEWKE